MASRRNVDGPSPRPASCPICGHEYESVTRHRTGRMVTFRENQRYARVCFDPVTVDGSGRLDFSHQRHGND